MHVNFFWNFFFNHFNSNRPFCIFFLDWNVCALKMLVILPPPLANSFVIGPAVINNTS